MTTSRTAREADIRLRTLHEIEKEFGPKEFDAGGLVKCRVCFCTETHPCTPACAWFEEDERGDICSTCAGAAAGASKELARWMEDARRSSKSNRRTLMLEAEIRLLMLESDIRLGASISYALAKSGKATPK